MVRIYNRVIRKRYLNQKRVYTHRHIAVPIPSKFHKQLEPLLGTELKITIDAQPNKLTITLTPKEREDD